MQADCDDARFTEDTGSPPALFDFWLESGCNTATTRFWVEVPSIPSGSREIDFYYGNSGASPMFPTSLAAAQATFRNNSIFRVGGECTSGTECGYLDNHAEADTIRASFGICARGYVTSISDTGQPCGDGDTFYWRYRFLFVPGASGSYGFLTNSDDGSEVGGWLPLDGYGGGVNTPNPHPYGAHTGPAVAWWYGGHGNAGTCGTGGTWTNQGLIANQGYWINYIWQEWGGGALGQMCINTPGVGWQVVDTTLVSMNGRIFAREYPASGAEPTTTVSGTEEQFALAFPSPFAQAEEGSRLTLSALVSLPGRWISRVIGAISRKF